MAERFYGVSTAMLNYVIFLAVAPRFRTSLLFELVDLK